MALYLGSSEKLRICANNVTCCLNVISDTYISNNAALLSSDRYTLKDSNGKYLLPNNSNRSE